MGASGILDHYSRLHPKAFFCETNVRYDGEDLDFRTKLAEANHKLEKFVPELQNIMVVSGPLFSGRNVCVNNSPALSDLV
jgi:hypothetical protein